VKGPFETIRKLASGEKVKPRKASRGRTERSGKSEADGGEADGTGDS
jgi:hypothetical protein